MTGSSPARITDAATHRLDAVLLAGGRATRLDGASKPDQTVAGRTLLDLAITAAHRAGARRIVVVGPPSLHAPGCLVVREDPPFGGPVAAIAAALDALDAFDALDAVETLGRSRSEAPRDTDPDPGSLPDPDPDPGASDVLVLACDLPRAPAAVELLLAHRGAPTAEPDDAGDGAFDGAVDGACLVDADGRTQWLAAIYARASLDRAFTVLGGPPNGVAMRHLVRGLRLAVVPDDGTAEDVDTWPDLERARARARARATHGTTSTAALEPPTRSTP